MTIQQFWVLCKAAAVLQRLRHIQTDTVQQCCWCCPGWIMQAGVHLLHVSPLFLKQHPLPSLYPKGAHHSCLPLALLILANVDYSMPSLSGLHQCFTFHSVKLYPFKFLSRDSSTSWQNKGQFHQPAECIFSLQWWRNSTLAAVTRVT